MARIALRSCAHPADSSAAIHLLRLLADHGAVMRYHGDFDGEGIRIAAYLLDRTPARPWRMSATDYRVAVARTPHGPELGRLTEAPWGPELARAMFEHGTAVVEELVDDVLDARMTLAAEVSAAPPQTLRAAILGPTFSGDAARPRQP